MNQSIHTIAALTELTPDGVLNLVKELAARWPDRPLAQLAREMQARASQEDARAERAPNVIPQIERLLRGIGIIRKYDPNPDLAAVHDVFYCGSYDTRDAMTVEERTLMDTYGWGEEYDSWRFFV